MQQHELRALIEEVRSGKVTRRSFVQRMVALGLTAPLAGQNPGSSARSFDYGD